MADTNKNPFAAIVTAIPDGANFITDVGTTLTNVWRVILNIGAADGVELKQKFVIFSLGPELFDPSTKESLGSFEIVQGEGEVVHVQEKMCQVRSRVSKLEKVPAKSALAAFQPEPQYEWKNQPKPFPQVTIGDLARRI